jgi:hypothetical protein
VSAVLTAIGHNGATSQVGKSYKSERLLNQNNPFSLSPRVILDLSDESPVAVNPVSEQGYTVAGQEALSLIGPTDLAERYDENIVPIGGVSTVGRTTPLIAIERHATVATMPEPATTVVQATGVNNLNARVIYAVDPPASIASTVAAQTVGGAGAPVSEVHPSVPSVQPGQQFTLGAQAWLPSVFVRPGAIPGAAATQHPAAGGVGQTLSSRFSNLINRFRG